MEVNYFKQFYFDYDSKDLQIEIVLPFTLTNAPGIMGFLLECFSKKSEKQKIENFLKNFLQIADEIKYFLPFKYRSVNCPKLALPNHLNLWLIN